MNIETTWAAILLLLLSACGVGSQPEPGSKGSTIDQRSYRLGVIFAFAEMVSVGVKKLALSSPMTPEEMDGLLQEAERIARENGVKLYREEDFLVTDLFPGSVTQGKHVLLIYLGPVKDEYMALKVERDALLEQGNYEGEARREVARKMGRLLSYPEERIEAMLAARR